MSIGIVRGIKAANAIASEPRFRVRQGSQPPASPKPGDIWIVSETHIEVSQGFVIDYLDLTDLPVYDTGIYIHRKCSDNIKRIDCTLFNYTNMPLVYEVSYITCMVSGVQVMLDQISIWDARLESWVELPQKELPLAIRDTLILDFSGVTFDGFTINDYCNNNHQGLTDISDTMQYVDFTQIEIPSIEFTTYSSTITKTYSGEESVIY